LCLSKIIIYNTFDPQATSFYECWEKVEEDGRDGKKYTRMAKTRTEATVHDIISRFQDLLLPFMVHEGNRLHQHATLKELKKTLADGDLLLHIDFSENYQTKYEREIQEVHFGGNRIQVSLHTGIAYFGQEKPKCFSTISQDLQHDPIAILCHLQPILQDYSENVKNIHFVSDSPFTQYRNRYMFHIMVKNIVPIFKSLETLSWNYTEVGHGKGGADGVGATVKRTADRSVTYGNDVATLDQFVETIQAKIDGIKLLTVRATNPSLKTEVWKNAPQVPGTQKVHQVKWSQENKHTLLFNSLSCFECAPNTECMHYSLLKKDYLIAKDLDSNSDIDDPEAVADELEIAVEKKSESKEAELDSEVYRYSVDDYVVVKFSLVETKGERRWLAKIMKIDDENDKIDVWFLKSKNTSQHRGYIYIFPELEPKLVTVSRAELAYKVQEPTKFQRFLKFAVHSDEL
jgi:hypothetical protein